MNDRQVLARGFISDRYFKKTIIDLQHRFDLKSLLEASCIGLPCACCYELSRRSAGDYHYDENGRKVQHFCDHCKAVICNDCLRYIMDNHGGQQLGCRWCGSDISRTMCSSHEKEILSRETCHANSNILIFFCTLGRIFPNQTILKVFWADIVTSIGWRFFIDFDVRMLMAHPTQFGLLMTMMIRNSFSRFRDFQPVLPSFHRQFSELPDDMRSLYRRSRLFKITHSFSIFLTYKLTDSRFRRQYSLTIQRVLAKSAEILTARLGICDIEEYDQCDLDVYDQNDLSD